MIVDDVPSPDPAAHPKPFPGLYLASLPARPFLDDDTLLLASNAYSDLVRVSHFYVFLGTLLIPYSSLGDWAELLGVHVGVRVRERFGLVWVGYGSQG